MKGSSPHTRGALVDDGESRDREGIIPAYAGSTGRTAAWIVAPWDHPRIRGEHAPTRLVDRWRDGSSPHTRGALSVGTQDSLLGGIIPAYAGSTCAAIEEKCVETDHPRIRGEHRDEHVELHRRAWIIPAYAGSTKPIAAVEHSRTDHPRIRGEHAGAGGRVDLDEGSSPHTRGALELGVGQVLDGWIIPAYAGSTRARRGVRSLLPDHPRIRGEHYGSSFARGRGIGIIPAYAGSTSPSFQPSRWLWDHPRIRGEHRLTLLSIVRSWGSSPHTRGAPAGSPPHSPHHRIIPAYAGSTDWGDFL